VGQFSPERNDNFFILKVCKGPWERVTNFSDYVCCVEKQEKKLLFLQFLKTIVSFAKPHII